MRQSGHDTPASIPAGGARPGRLRLSLRLQSAEPLAQPGPQPDLGRVAVGHADRVPTPSPTLEPTPVPSVPIVPVADFRTIATSIDQAGVAAILAGTNKQFTTLELVSADADGIMTALGLAQPSVASRLVLAPTAAALETDLDTQAARLGIVRATDVGPSVRALGWGNVSLFGVARVKSLADWPLQARLPAAAGTAAFNPSATWTVVAGGDMMFDRGVYKVMKIQGKGVDFPFSGGTATITSRYCCSSWDWVMPRTKRDDTTQDVRSLTSGADLALANLEGPAPQQRQVPRHGNDLHLQSGASLPGFSTPASIGSPWATTTSSTPAGRASSRRSRPWTSSGSPTAAPARTSRRRGLRPCSRSTA